MSYDPSGLSHKERIKDDLKIFEMQVIIQRIRAFDKKVAELSDLRTQKETDSNKTGTFSLGFSLSGSFVVGGTIEAGMAVDARGNAGFYFNSGELVGTPTAGGCVSIAISDAPSVEHLGGPGYVAGGSVDVCGGVIGVDYSKFYAQDAGILQSYSFNAGVGIGPVAKFHSGSTRTYVVSTNPYDLRVNILEWWYLR